MAFYRETKYQKDNSGKYQQKETRVSKAPADVGRWGQSGKMERQGTYGERTRFVTEPTRGGLNQKVVRATTYFPDGEKIDRTLITTANRLPKKYR